MDLIRAIPDIDPATIWDLGCGTGAITRMLAARWPDANVHGLDSSESMLAEATDGDPDATVSWVVGDISDWSPETPIDLVFANASLHWVDDHDTLFSNLVGQLSQGGVLAVQMPRNFGEPSHQVLYEVARRPRWEARVGHRAGWCPVDEPSRYFDRLSPLCSDVDLWETEYFQGLHGEDAVAEWVKGTAARPFLDDLGDEGEAFFAEYAAAVRSHYPRRSNGSTLLPFRRLFLIATR